ncbi:hypothetical protein [Rubinisphaera sp.]|uniref:hypothetical protein n=1 Tax=Rubinisphaera sp. TaxID=2024857 RepID=UPI000C10ADE1|nr:hypothetical protein [Rubinisphaera sp.]MBV08790.1 hypothetical protein [Rubinisphaera sp.]HCS52385.1 hypothetical protein [Planctomycetaceae bacterium]|tara:strand:- start:38 stop:1531 length:1494 start_codon:yes stop_codon:yes gene_type:complete
MDKLKPIIDHHFWIILGLVLILPLIGWWPAVGQFNTQRETKISEIDGAFQKVPKTPQPNQSWSEGVNKIAEVVEEKNQQEKYELWRRQEKMMTWPNRINRDLRPTSYLGDIPSKARVIYRNGYNIDVTSVWKQIDPFDPMTGKGTVIFPESLVPKEVFGDLPPTTVEIWEAQEDLWLLESLFKSIRRANSDASIVTDSLVRSITNIRLVGGPGDYPDAEPSGDTGSGMDDEYAMEDMYSEMGPDGNPLNSNRTMNLSASSVSFDPSEEFGDEQGRYIDYKEGTVFKKRGFYLEAIIEHQRLPELLVHLSNGDWPVTISRVQIAQAGASSTLLGGNNYEEDPTYTGNPFAASPMSRGEEYNYADGGETGATGLTGGTPENMLLAKAATTGPSLAKVAICGIIHIYNPVEPVETKTETTTAPVETPEVTPEESVGTPEPTTTEPADDLMPADDVTGEQADDLEIPETPDTAELPETTAEDVTPVKPATDVEELEPLPLD